jgi:hypothetical protein
MIVTLSVVGCFIALLAFQMARDERRLAECRVQGHQWVNLSGVVESRFRVVCLRCGSRS